MTIRAGSAVKTGQELTVAIFGRWASTAEIMARLGDPSCKNSFDGRTLTHKAAGKISYGLSLLERDSSLVASVVSCGAGRLEAGDIEAVSAHTHYVVLSGPVENSKNSAETQLDAALDMLHTAAALVQDIRGDVVHVATAGITHTLASWVEMNNQCSTAATVNAFVQRIGGGGVFFSCGMHAFGYADVYLTENFPSAEGSKVLFEFLLHTLSAGLAPQGEPFIFEPQSVEVPGGLLATSGKCVDWDENSAFYNRFGVWNLVRA